MKVAIVGSRDLIIKNLGNYLPDGTTEIVSGGAKGIDTCAKEYAEIHGVKLTEFLPMYDKYPERFAPLKRNDEIIEYSDMVLVFWNGKNRGSAYVIKKCRDRNVAYIVFKPVK